MKELYYATGNIDKYKTVADFLKKYHTDIDLKQYAADITEIQSLSQEAIARDKALQAWRMIQKPVLVDDSALYVERYKEFPGVLSKYIDMTIGMDGVRKLCEPGDAAFFRLALVYCAGPGEIHVFEGRCDGVVSHQQEFIGAKNYPYDTIFVPHGSGKTYAELRQTGEHEPFDYRIQALKKFLDWYRQS